MTAVSIDQLEMLARAMPPESDALDFLRVIKAAVAAFSQTPARARLSVPSEAGEKTGTNSAASQPPRPRELVHVVGWDHAVGPSKDADPVVARAVSAGRSGFDWTAEEEAELLRLRAEGVPVREAARRLDRPLEATRKRLERFSKGLTPPPADRAEGTGFRRRKDGWTPAEVDQMTSMRADGRSFPEIAKIMSRDADAVRKAVRRGVPVINDPVKVLPPIRPDAWTQEQDAILVQRFREAAPIADVAAELRRTVKACQVRVTRLRQLGWFDKQRPAAVEAAPQVQAPAEPTQERAAPAPPPAAVKMPAPPSQRPADRIQMNGLTGLQREVAQHLSQLDRDEFTPADDLYLAESLVARVPLEVIGDTLGCAGKTVLARFGAMKFPSILTDRKHLTIDGQAALMAVLRLRAQAAV